MTSSWSNPGRIIKPINTPYTGSFTVLVFKTMVVGVFVVVVGVLYDVGGWYFGSWWLWIW